MLALKFIDDREVAVGLATGFDFERVCARRGASWSKRMNGRAMLERASSVVCRRSTSFLRRSDLARAGSGGEAGDEFVELGDFLFALGVFGFEAGADLRLRQHHVVVAAGVGDDRLVIDIGDVGADAVEEVAVVRDGDEGAFEAGEEILQPVDGFEIEVVGGLVEEQGLGPPKRAWASSTRTFWPPWSSPILRSWRALRCRGPPAGWRRRFRRCSRLLRRRCLRVRRGACRLRRSARTSRKALSRSARADQSGRLPMMTVSMTRKASKAN
jgi:hypothetical protein